MNKRANIAPPVQSWPTWANWCGLDPAGYWVFYENEPITTSEGRLPNGGQWGIPRECDVAVYESWEALTFSRLAATVH